MLGALLGACVDGGDRDPDPDAGPDPVPIRSCATTFTHRPAGDVGAVEVAGAWDWDAREPLTYPDRDGTYTLTRELPAGQWAYKLVITRPGGDVEWILDPANP